MTTIRDRIRWVVGKVVLAVAFQLSLTCWLYTVLVIAAGVVGPIAMYPTPILHGMSFSIFTLLSGSLFLAFIEDDYDHHHR